MPKIIDWQCRFCKKELSSANARCTCQPRHTQMVSKETERCEIAQLNQELREARGEEVRASESDAKDTINVFHDPVNHPLHYTLGRYEVIDVIDDWKLDFYRGQVVKYVARAGKKGGEIEDLEKAKWYLDRYIVIKKQEHK